MIHVIASISVKPEYKEEFINIFKANIPAVLAEKGCISYSPALDLATGLPPQIPQRDDVITIIEAWDSLDHLKAHLKAPHMLAYKEQTKEMTTGLSLQVLKPA